MNREESIKSIIERRKENEGDEEVICIREINQNINRIMTNQPLTRPLRVLNRSCEFKKRYEEVFNFAHEAELKQEVKKRVREYMRRKLNIPKSRWKI